MITAPASPSPNNENGPETARLVELVHSTFSTLFNILHRKTTHDEVVSSGNSPELASMSGKKMLLVDDSLYVICQVFPLLTGATGGTSSVIAVSKEGLGEESYSLLTARSLAERIVAAKPDFILMDWDLGKDFDGVDVVQHLSRLAPDLPCIGFSGESGVFDHCPVTASVRKNRDDMMQSLIQVADVVRRRCEIEVANSDTPLAPLTTKRTRDQHSTPELLIATSILCQGYLLLFGNADHQAAIGLKEPIPEERINRQAGAAFRDPKMWKDVLARDFTLAKLNEEILDPGTSKTLIEFLAGLCRGDITEIKLETVALVLQEIEVELRS